MSKEVTNESPLLVRPREAARLLSVSPRTLWTLTRAGVVPCVRLGRSVRYSPATLREILVPSSHGNAKEHADSHSRR